MAEYRLDTSWKAWRSRMKQAFIEGGSRGALMGSIPIAAIWAAFDIGSGASFMVSSLAVAFIVSYAGAHIIRENDQRMVDILNAQEGGAA